MVVNIPKDPAILLSYVNTQLRDFYTSLDDMCKSIGINREETESKLSEIGYAYDEDRNQFI